MCSSPSRLAATLVLLASAAASPAAAEPSVGEVELVRSFLGSAAQRAAASALRAQADAAQIVPPYLRHPELELRREQAFGEGTAFSTTVAGMSLSLEIGGRHSLRTRAAAHTSAAIKQGALAERLESICAVRRLVLRAASAQRRLGALERGQRRLEALLKMLERLVRSGEKAPFELDRARLLIKSHARAVTRQRAETTSAFARLGALTGRTIGRLDLPQAAAGPSPRRSAQAHPRVQSLRLEARAADTRGAIAARSWVPDLGVRGAYRLDYAGGAGPGHGYELGLSLNLPFSDVGRADRAAATARQAHLRALASRTEAVRAARAAALRARVQTLAASRGREQVVDLDKLHRDAVRRYLGGVTPLGDLVDTLKAAESAALQRLRDERALRSARLDLECLRGAFDDVALEQILRAGVPDRQETK